MDIVQIRALCVCNDSTKPVERPILQLQIMVMPVEPGNTFAGMVLVSLNQPQVQILHDQKRLLLVLHCQLVRWNFLFVVGMEVVLIRTFHLVPQVRIVDQELFDVKMELVVRKDNVHSLLVVQ